ncbi:STAS domain-containing protein [Mycolicibacterium sp. F2034L]|uniref:STAS domain-containing protein n=1 Tax=Mycolicibacterium sp. F2034L TaxID=2926422 RepID=UPI001FF16629|nr:STAS domain-containing protein [Mycolicibacterium sp. F2034L]MCK0176125.1 STAS domain-containing protein [Mycolicibacterium sp. F2034L]
MTISHLDDHRRSVQRVHRLTVTSRVVGGSLTVCVAGSVDAHNAKDLAVAVCDAVVDHHGVVVDLSALEFAGVDTVSALHAINATFRRDEVDWALVPNRAVSRVLDLCDPERLIPRPAPEPEAEPA